MPQKHILLFIYICGKFFIIKIFKNSEVGISSESNAGENGQTSFRNIVTIFVMKKNAETFRVIAFRKYYISKVVK